MKIEEAIYTLERLAHTEAKWPGTEDTLEALDMAINTLHSMPKGIGTNDGGWISVEDRLPERFEPVLVCREKNGSPYVEQGYKDVGEWWKVYGTRTKQVTHWMPIPNPPKEETP